MRIEKKHKIYAGLVGAALVAWAIDSMFFSAPPAGIPVASAAVAPPPAPPVPHETPVAAAEASASDETTQWLAARLRAWSDNNPTATDDVPDAFSVPASWLPKKSAGNAPPKSPEKLAEDFSREHHLTAVLLDAAGSSALIDGRFVHIGQTVGNCRLKSVRSGSALLLAPDGTDFRVYISPDNENPGR